MKEIFDFFKQETANRNWEEVKKNLIAKTASDADTRLEKMKTLIKYRDNVDYYLYKSAVEKIFSAEHYQIKVMANIDSITESTNQLLIFKSPGYVFEVSKKNKQESEQTICCQIAICATGSSTVTSTLDTSTLVSMCSKFNDNSTTANVISVADKKDFFANTSNNICNNGVDYEGRVANAVLMEFNVINEDIFGMSSTEQRDSNAYLDTITNDEVDYAKFNNTEDNNPTILRDRLFTEKEFLTKFAKNKTVKCLQEQAASLVLLCQNLSATEWQGFKKLVLDRGKAIIKQQLDDGRFDVQTKIVKYQEVFAEDIDTIFVMANEIVQACKEELEHEIAAKRKTAYSQKSPVKDQSHALEKDIEASVKNRLYVKYLEEATSFNGKIIELKLINATLLEQVRALVVADSSNIKEINLLKDNLKENLYLIAHYQNIKQKYSNKALVFANKAYTNRSAVYHVVRGMQEKRDITITEQVIMGSALQQIGFKFAHVKELRDADKAEEEIAYLTAKYGFRLYNLLFNDIKKINNGIKISSMETHVPNAQVISFLTNGHDQTFRFLDYLKSKQVKENCYKSFAQNELLMLNSDAEIIATIKKQNIPDNEKPARTLVLLRNRMHELNKTDYPEPEKITKEQIKYFSEDSEKKLFLSIGANIIGLVYASKFERLKKSWSNNIDLNIDTQHFDEKQVHQFRHKM